MTQTSTYHQLSDKIKNAQTIKELKRLELSAERIYNAGLINAYSYGKLDGMIFTRIAKEETR
jgi:hypothetical protein